MPRTAAYFKRIARILRVCEGKITEISEQVPDDLVLRSRLRNAADELRLASIRSNELAEVAHA
jgi:hypothetical protein